MEELHVLADVLEHVARDHIAHAVSKPVIQTERRTVEHHPEPDQWFPRLVFFRIDVAVVLGFKSDVARIEGMRNGSTRKLRRYRSIVVRLVFICGNVRPAEVNLM